MLNVKQELIIGHFTNMPIFEQLQIEEALLRAGSGNWCLINEGSPHAIVMGISGKSEELVNFEALKTYPMPIIRRFSGGGTVIVEENTLFISFIFDKSTLNLGTCPQELLNWTGSIYHPLFSHSDFAIRENDYTIGDKKIGGNAQYFTKNRVVHHTSFLWDFCPEKMRVLKIPEKTPAYRMKRDHNTFLSKVSTHFTSKDAFIEGLKEQLAKQFTLCTYNSALVEAALALPHRKSLTIIDL